MCYSQAWESKIVTSAWWVYPHQVSKTAPTGEYLTAGSFMIRGKKNFLPPHSLVMGFGILFRLDESSLGSHLNERRVRGEEEELHDLAESESVKEDDDSRSDGEVTCELADNIKKLAPLTTDHPQLNADVTSKFQSTHGGSLLPDENPVREKHPIPKDIENGCIAEENVLSNPSQLEALIDRALGLGSAKVPGKDFGLDGSQQTLSEDHDHEEKKGTQREKPYVSKAERRKFKKGQKSGSDIAAGVHEKEGNEVNVSDIQPNKSDFRPPGGRITRGQRGKLKKIKEKYAEQDDEERKIRMALLAVSNLTIQYVSCNDQYVLHGIFFFILTVFFFCVCVWGGGNISLLGKHLRMRKSLKTNMKLLATVSHHLLVNYEKKILSFFFLLDQKKHIIMVIALL